MPRTTGFALDRQATISRSKLEALPLEIVLLFKHPLLSAPGAAADPATKCAHMTARDDARAPLRERMGTNPKRADQLRAGAAIQARKAAILDQLEAACLPLIHELIDLEHEAAVNGEKALPK